MKLTDLNPEERDGLAALEPRIGRIHLRQRLGLEGEREAQVFPQGHALLPHRELVFRPRPDPRALTLAGLHGAGGATRCACSCGATTPRCVAATGLRRLHAAATERPAPGHRRGPAGAPGRERARLDYDACVLTGDFRFRTFGRTSRRSSADPLAAAVARPVYACSATTTASAWCRHGTARIRVLLNESVRIERGSAALHLAGIDDAHYYRTHSFHAPRTTSAPGLRDPAVAHARAYRLAAQPDSS